MHDKAAERRRKQREKVIDMYRFFAKSFWTAYKENDQTEMDKCANRTYNFRLGVTMADPKGRWYHRFSQIDHETMKDMGIDDTPEIRWTEESEDV